MIRAVVLCVGLFLLASTARANPAQNCNQTRDLGRTIRGCTEFIQQTGDSQQVANAYYNRGNAYSARNDHDRAIADYSKAIQINPKHGHAYNNRGRVYWTKKDYDHAIADQSKAIEVTKLAQVKAHAHYNLGVAYRDKKDDDRAIAEYTKAIQLKTNETEVNVRAHLNRGVAHLTKGDHERAIADLTKALAISPKRADAYWKAGGVVSVKNDAYDARAWAYLKVGKAEQALPDAERSLRLHPSASALSTRGHIYEALGKREEAIADFRRAVVLTPNDQEVQSSGKEALKRLGAEP